MGVLRGGGGGGGLDFIPAIMPDAVNAPTSVDNENLARPSPVKITMTNKKTKYERHD